MALAARSGRRAQGRLNQIETMPPDDPAPRRIAYLTGEYPAVSHTFILREVEAVRSAGLEVVTCSVRRPGPQHLRGAAEAREADGTFYILDAARRPQALIAAVGHALARPARLAGAIALAWRTRPPGARALVWQIFYIAEAMILSRELTRRGVDHIHNHFAQASCSVAMLTSALSGLPFSFTLHGPADFFEPRTWHLGEKIARARLVACISHFCRSQGMIFADPAHWPKMRIVHCGVDPARYGHPDARTGKTLMFVGRLAAVKGVLVLLDALVKARTAHPDLRLVLVGDGPERPRIVARVAELGLQACVEFAGYRTQDEVANLLAGADAFVLPSFAEGVPVVLMEAMASGLPVIATRVAGVPELVTDGETGLLVPPGDTASLARAIVDLLDTPPHRRAAMGEAGRAKVVQDFDQSREGAWLADLFRNVAPAGTLRPGDPP
jgi:glycosyltransferase involved in cell wall biosynthesis